MVYLLYSWSMQLGCWAVRGLQMMQSYLWTAGHREIRESAVTRGKAERAVLIITLCCPKSADLVNTWPPTAYFALHRPRHKLSPSFQQSYTILHLFQASLDKIILCSYCALSLFQEIILLKFNMNIFNYAFGDFQLSNL